jgi:hypothetical protein
MAARLENVTHFLWLISFDTATERCRDRRIGVLPGPPDTVATAKH